jgi:hypothetical protein
MNYNANTPNIANAAVVPLGTGGAITIRADAVTIDMIIDVNGYYASAAANQTTTFEVDTAAPWAITGKTSSSNTLATGVLGQANAQSGNTIGVWGETFSSTDGARGVMGFAQGTAGITYGVQGLTLSNSPYAAGVYGLKGSDPGGSLTSAGVRGGSVTHNGVLGISRNDNGVVGAHVDSTGSPQTTGCLGCSATYGVFAEGQIGATGAKPFIEPHPTDPTKEIAYVALEGPEAGTYFRGRGRIHNGTGVIMVPESFRFVSDEEGLTVQITPIGLAADVALVSVVSAGLNTITVQSSARDLEFFYVVNGVRKAFKDWEVITENRHYVPGSPEARMPGAYAPEQRRRLIATGIYNADGTVNLETAERLGWGKAWRDREEQAKAAAAAHRAAPENR